MDPWRGRRPKRLDRRLAAAQTIDFGGHCDPASLCAAEPGTTVIAVDGMNTIQVTKLGRRSALAVLLVAAAGASSAGDMALDHDQANRVVEQLLVASPYRLPASARAGTIRYTFRFEDGRHWVWPQTGEQRAARDADRWTLTVCRQCGREPSPDAAALQRYRAANTWVDSDHPRVRRFARREAGGGSVATRMRRLTEAVRAHMDGAIDYRHYHSASQTLRSRSGDCTEAAVLLAAAARAIGVPARLAFGLAYSSRFTGRSHVFSPHAWVQVWDGDGWRSFDAGLGEFDAGLIALQIGDGSAEALPEVTRAIHQLRIESATEVRTRPSREAAGFAMPGAKTFDAKSP
jgi:hypothetical protein